MAEKFIGKRIPSARKMDTLKQAKSENKGRGEGLRLLERAGQAWESLREFRERRARAMRFVYGDQWGDLITVNVDGEAKTMTMREYMALDGNIPQQTNQLKSMVDTVTGVFEKEQNEPVANAIDRDEQQFGELLTIGLQANNGKNRIRKIHSLCAKELLIGGISMADERWGYRENDKRREDSWTRYVDPDYIILETTMRDPRFWDMTMVGTWFRMPFNMLAADLINRGSIDYKTLRGIYADAANSFSQGDSYDLTERGDSDALCFMTPVSRNECCVAEIWTLETKPRIELHDWNEGTLEYIDASDKEALAEIDATNAERLRMGRAAGIPEEEIPVIDKRHFIDEFWYCRLIAPEGTILWEGESTAPDRSHPYAIVVTPFINGRISGYITDGIDHQIAINRALVLQDWLVRNQVKGFTMIPQQLVPDDMTNEEFVKTGISMGNYFFYDADKARGLEPKVFQAGAVSFDASGYINMLKQLLESSTAISGAIQGKTPYSGTSAALYAQQTANSSTPIASLLADIRTFMEDIAIKKAKNLAAFYDEGRWRSIAGRIDGIFDTDNLNFNDIADLEFDVIIKESSETPIRRAIANDYLMSFFQAGAISLEELLKNGDFPFSDKLLQSRQAREAEMQAAQEGEMGTMAQGQAKAIENPVQTEGYGLPVQSTRQII